MARECDPETLKALLIGHSLFAGLGSRTFKALEFEIRLSCDPKAIPESMPPRPSYIRFFSCGSREVLVPQGELTTELFLLIDGVARASRREPGRGTELLSSFRKGDWFGEASALSNQPSLVTVEADSPCELAALDHRLFRELYKKDMALRDRVNLRYRERSLLPHLRAAPLLAGLAARDLEAFRQQAKFRFFEKGARLATQGDEARAFYFIRSGAVECFREEGGKRRVLAYYMGNSSFGEHVLVAEKDSRTWPGTCEAMAWTDAVEVPREVFESIRASNPEAYRALTATANLILRGDVRSLTELYAASRDRGERMMLDELEVMVSRESVKGGEALVIDQKKCIRCNLCVESCVSVHDDGIPRISKVGTRVASDNVLITACYHCAIPECMASCNYGAIRRDSRGEVVFVHENCVGCNKCVESCPYGVIRMTAPRSPAEPRPSWLSALLSPSFYRELFWPRRRVPVSPEGGAGRSPPLQVMNVGGKVEEVAGKAIKCDLCQGLPFEACVYNCPTSAISRRAPEDLFHERGLAKKGAVP